MSANQHGAYTVGDLARIRAMLKAGAPLHAIAHRMGRQERNLRKKLQTLGWAKEYAERDFFRPLLSRATIKRLYDRHGGTGAYSQPRDYVGAERVAA